MKTFTMKDENFTCKICGREVKKLGRTARDHCPYCLNSIHVDMNPGDRLANCGGILEPIGVEKKRDTYQIVYRCNKCHQIKKNIIAEDDNMDLIISLSKNIL